MEVLQVFANFFKFLQVFAAFILFYISLHVRADLQQLTSQSHTVTYCNADTVFKPRAHVK